MTAKSVCWLTLLLVYYSVYNIPLFFSSHPGCLTYSHSEEEGKKGLPEIFSYPPSLLSASCKHFTSHSASRYLSAFTLLHRSALFLLASAPNRPSCHNVFCFVLFCNHVTSLVYLSNTTSPFFKANV